MPTGDGRIRLMIVDDSAVARVVLARMIAAHPDLELVATAANVGEALHSLIATKVDVVLLDVEMPGTSGLEGLPEILRRGNGARVLVLSSLCENGAEATVRALALGAADTLPKPGAGTFGGRFSDVLADRLRRIGRGHGAADATAFVRGGSLQRPLRLMPASRIDCLALAASTGGPHALTEFLEALPKKVDAPIVITQHLPPLFMPFFAREIERASGRPTCLAEEGRQLEQGAITIARGDTHLGLKRVGGAVVASLTRQLAESGCMPSADPMIRSVGDVFGTNGVAVLLSGMGRDGFAGSMHLAEQGGTILAQDEHSSAVWGMPRAVVEAGLASAVLPPGALAYRVAEYGSASAAA